jgi:protein-tyrosine phosphatase
MTRILMICLGNICRSPLAHGILESKLPKENFFVDSAGTLDFHVGNPPDKRSIETAFNHHINISNQKCRTIKKSDFDIFDYIYVMDIQNLKDVLAIAPSNHKHKVKMILNELFPNENVEVPDPYYGNINDFENVYEMLDQACDIIANQLLKN